MEHLKGSTESSRKLNLASDPKAIDSFDRLKRLLTSPELLAYPDFDSNEKFILDTDYSNEGIGVVLSQIQDGVERPIAFNARKLKPSESQYASHKGELLALIFGINSYKFFLTGKSFLVRTDNNALSWLKSQKDAKGMLKRWLRILSTYEFEVKHRPGTQHANADALSRAPHAPTLDTTEATELLDDDQILEMNSESDASFTSDSPDVEEDWDPKPTDTPIPIPNLNLGKLRDAQRADPVLQKVINWLETKHKPTGQEFKLLQSDEKQYANLYELLSVDQSGILKLKSPGSDDQRICLPDSYHQRVFYSLHHKNHGGGNALASTVQARYYFPRLVTLSRKYVFQCPRCQKLAKKKPQKHTYGHDIVGCPGEKVCLDFVGPLKKTRKGNTSLLTIVDAYTKWFHAWPVKNQKAETVIKHLINDYIPLRGVPAVVHSDNGPAFVANVFQNAMNHFDVKNTTTPVYNPKSNSVERYHRTLKRKLTALIHEFDDEWDEALPATLLAMRTSVNRTTGFSPFFLEHGREARLPIDLVTGSPDIEVLELPLFVTDISRRFKKAFQVVMEKQKEYILRQQNLFREHDKRIKVNDLVWLYTERANPELNRKFQSFWSGPFRVVQQVTSVLFKIETHGRWSCTTITIIAAVDRLKKCYITDPETNQGLPVALTANDLRPYYDDSPEVLGKLPAYEFAPHYFEEDEELPFTIPTEHPEDPPEARLPQRPSGTGSRVTVPPGPPLDDFSTPAPAPEPSVLLPPAEPQVEPTSPPPTPRRKPGRPKGSKNKNVPCSECVAFGICKRHCDNCINEQPCRLHFSNPNCSECTADALCSRHQAIANCSRCTRTRRCATHRDL